MNPPTAEGYEAVNSAHWDEVAELHRVSYNTPSLIKNRTGLSTVVVEDARLLAPYLPGGSVAGLDLLHVQCHIGTDTLSWARLGARVTGLDLSHESLRVARELSAEAGVDVDYVQSSVHDAATALAGRDYDVVYTSIGVLAWLDDLGQWARLIAGLLRPGGIFFIHEGHPMAMSLDFDAPEGELRLAWPYFDIGPQVEDSGVDYSSPVPVEHARTYEWAHGLGDILGSLLKAGLTILDFQEHQTLPWSPLPWMKPDPADPLGWYALPAELRPLCPLAFSLVARR